MAGFAEIALVVSLCVPGGANPGEAQALAQAVKVVQSAGFEVDGGCIDQVRKPQTWASANILEASQDWEQCKAMERVEPLQPGEVARCQYTALAGMQP